MKDIVSNALPSNAYEFQASLPGEGGGTVRVDCLIQIPNPPGPVPVDSKFPLEGYHALRTAQDEPSRKAVRRLLANRSQNTSKTSPPNILCPAPLRTLR